MILKSVQLNNFMCYYGNNEFEFTEGLNVIIGDNGYGKSKIYDAIYWVMYDECYDTSAEEFRPTKLMNNKFISDRAIHEADDGQIECSVSLKFYDDRREETYKLQRILRATKEDGNINFGKNSIRKVKKKSQFGVGSIVSDDKQIKRIEKRILPDNIKPYMWFQGEQIENIIDFKNSETLTKAINVLSDITKYNNISSITDSLYKSAEKELKKKKKALSKDKKKSDKLEEKITKKKSQLTDYEAQLQSAKNEAEKAQDKIDDLLSKKDIAEKIKELDKEKDHIKERFNRIVHKLKEEQYSFHEKLFTRSWVLKGAKDLFQLYTEKKAKYDQKKLDQKAEIQAQKNIEKRLQTRLPINVPKPIYINKMLEEQKCLVCNRDAPEGSDAYEAINGLLADTRETKNELENELSNQHDFSTYFNALYENGLKQEDPIDVIEQDIANTLSKMEELKTQKDKLKEELSDINNNIDNYIIDSSIGLNESKRITSGLKANHSIVSDRKVDIGHFEKHIDDLKQEIGRLEKKVNNLVSGDIPDKLVNKEQVCSDLKKAALSTRNRVYQDLITKLEQEANKHYANMTQDNKAARGIIHLREYKGNYTPELLDDEGNKFTNINTGNLLLIKLATIMAIISARKSTHDTYLYTLISDAPMSVFGEDFTIGFCMTTSQVYRQSIVMSKDFYKNDSLRNQLMTSDNINLGNVYMITPNIPVSERENRFKLSTIIEKLN